MVDGVASREAYGGFHCDVDRKRRSFSSTIFQVGKRRRDESFSVDKKDRREVDLQLGGEASSRRAVKTSSHRGVEV